MDANDKKVSIVVPVYNGEAYIKKCVESLLKQTYKPLEIILVNDGSEDGTAEVCAEYAGKFESVKFVNKKNEGVTLARLDGIKSSSGNYIAFVDADDWIDDKYIEQMMSELEDGDIILSGITKVVSDEDGHALEERNLLSAGVYKEDEEKRILFERMLCYDTPFRFGILPYACNKIYKKNRLISLMESVDKSIYDGEDVAIIFPYLLNSEKIVLSDYCGYNYLIHKGSVCAQKRDDAYGNASRLYLWLYEAFSGTKYVEIMLPQLRDYFLRMVWKRDPSTYIQANDYAFPFHRVQNKSKILIYGVGDVGKAYYTQVKQTNYCEVVACADKNVEYSEGIECRIIKPEAIVEMDFDYVIIAIRSKYINDVVFKYLLNMGVSADKIITCDVEDD